MEHLSYVSIGTEDGGPPITYPPHHLCHISLRVILQRLSVSFHVSLFVLSLSLILTHMLIHFVVQRSLNLNYFYDWEDIKLPVAEQNIHILSRLFFNKMIHACQ